MTSTWTNLHTRTTQGILLADRDATGRDEIVLDFGPGVGVWQYANESTWSQVNGLSPEEIAAGRLH